MASTTQQFNTLEKEFQNDSYLRSQNHLNMDGMFLIYAPLQNVLMGNQRWLPLQNKMTIKGHILISKVPQNHQF
jgi:hypothetical protein